MRVFQSPDHANHAPKGELSGGQLVPPFECLDRMDLILARLKLRGFDDIHLPGMPDMASIRATHDPGFLTFLETGYQRWVEAGWEGDMIAACWPARRMQTARPPRNIDGQAGYYALAAETAITAGTWKAALSSAACAQSAAAHVAGGERASFALCRPPGHHATHDMYGGYCFLNNAGLAAERLLSGGARKVAILDIDFHHGNGTQDMFYQRGDVFFASLHGAPEDAFPFFLGYADETGEGAGEGTTANYPMPPGTSFDPWSEALKDAIFRATAWGAEAVVVSLGVDAHKDDPISFFKLDSDDFARAGTLIAKMGVPTVLCMEGGYDLRSVGVNTVNVLEGFLAAG